MPSTLLEAKTLCATSSDVGMNAADPRLVDRINEAQRRLLRHYNFIVRKEAYDSAALTYAALAEDGDELLVDDLDATKLMCLALWREENNVLDQAGLLEKRAHELLEESLTATVEAAQKVEWQAALASEAIGTFGHTKARLGLDLGDVMLRFSDARVGRLVNAAEELLMQKGKPVGSIADYKFDVPEDGLVLLPVEIESVLFAAFGDIPAPVYRHAYDFLENGPGYQTAESRGWAAVMVARGEVGGRRQYFVRNPVPDECVRVLAKKRFIPHTSDAEVMTVRNYHALREMVLSFAKAAMDIPASVAHSENALREVAEELAEHRGGERMQQGFQVKGAARPVRGLR